MPDEYKGVEFDQPEKANQTTPVMAGHQDLSNLRKMLGDGPKKKRGKPSKEKLEEALDARLAISGSRRTMDAISFVAYIILGIDLVLGAIGQRSLIQIIWWLPYAFRYPLEFVLGWIKPGLEMDPTVADAVVLAIWVVCHLSLRAIHKKITRDRLYVPA